MGESWKNYLLRQFARDNPGRDPRDESQNAEDPQLVHLRQKLEELRGRAVQDSDDVAKEFETPDADSEAEAANEPGDLDELRARREGGPSPVEYGAILDFARYAGSIPAGAEPEPPLEPDDLSATQRFVAEQRRAAEALLREARALEDRLKNEAVAMQVVGESAAADEKLTAAGALRQEARMIAQAAVERHAACEAARSVAADLVAAARADARTAEAHVLECKERLKDAEQLASQVLAMLDQRSARAREYAEKERAAAAEVAEAAEFVKSCEAAFAAAERNAEAARERANAVKQSFAGSQTFVDVDEIESVAQRIAQIAATLKGEPPED